MSRSRDIPDVRTILTARSDRRPMRLGWHFVAVLGAVTMVIGLVMILYGLDAWWRLLPWHWQW